MRRLFFIFPLLLAALFSVNPPAMAQEKVVYHFDDAKMQATRGLRSIRNHLDTAPNTQITAIAIADGVDFLMEGAKDSKNGIEYSSLISDLVARGVKFQICELTLRLRNLKQSQFMLEASYTTSGVVRLVELQNKEHYAYIKP